MWNGFWKITAMVGVIGVGSFAAYQAHKGMNSPVVNTAGETPSDSADAENVDSSNEFRPNTEFSADGPIRLTDVTIDSGIRKSSSSRSNSADTESQFDNASEPPTQKALHKKTIASTGTEPKLLPVKQRVAVDFRDNEEPETKPSEPKRSQQLTKEDSTTTKSRRQSIRQVSETSTDDEPAIIENASVAKTSDNSFFDDAPSGHEENSSSTDDAAPLTEPLDEPAKTQATSDFDSDPPPVISNRAKKKSESRAETQSEATADFTEEVTSEPKSDSTTKPSTTDDDFGVPGKIAEPLEPETMPKRDSAPLAVPKTLPTAPASTFEDDKPSNISTPNLERQTSPPASQEPSSGDKLGERSLRKRQPTLKRAEYDRVSPIDDKDMVGDGVAGDISLRGVQQPRLTIEKIAKDQAVLDQPLIYTIIVKNTGTVDAHNVVIEDRIPKGTELQGTSPQAELSGKRLIWNHLLLKPNEEKKISIKVIPKQEGPIGSVARVYFATEVTAEIVVAAPQLEFTVKVPREVRLGQRFEMIFNLKNVGKVEATNVIVRDIVPEFLKNESGNDIECPVGKIAPGESREIVLPVVADKTGSVINRAFLQADSGIKKTLDSNIDIVGEVLVLTRSGQNRLYVERTAVFTNSIKNEGNQRADTVRISEVVPAGMEFEKASDGGKYDPNLRAVVWTIGPLAPGNDKQVTVNYVPKETGTHPAKITATGSAGSTAAINSSVEVVGKPELQMETLSATGVVTLGEKITSRFQLSNTGTAPANNVQLRIQLPNELRLVSVKGAKFQQRGNEVLFDMISELAPRSKAAYELVLEPIEEADAEIMLEISADHLTRPGRRKESIQIARDALKE